MHALCTQVPPFKLPLDETAPPAPTPQPQHPHLYLCIGRASASVPTTVSSAPPEQGALCLAPSQPKGPHTVPLDHELPQEAAAPLAIITLPPPPASLNPAFTPTQPLTMAPNLLAPLAPSAHTKLAFDYDAMQLTQLPGELDIKSRRVLVMNLPIIDLGKLQRSQRCG